MLMSPDSGDTSLFEEAFDSDLYLTADQSEDGLSAAAAAAVARDLIFPSLSDDMLSRMGLQVDVKKPKML